MKNEKILVLGSGPQEVPKNINFSKIYASNASIIKCKSFIKSKQDFKVISVTTLNGIFYDDPTKDNINIIKPSKIVIRRSDANKIIDLNFKCKVKNFDKFQQWEYQKKFFYFSTISLFLSEFFYGNTLRDKILNFLNAFHYKKKNLLGVSTGFFAILLALDENQYDDIYISGITMDNSDHFYKLSEKTKRIFTRHKVDNFLIKFLKKKYKKRIFSNDENFIKLAGVNYFK